MVFGGSPNEPWFIWLKEALELHGFIVVVPKLSNTFKPKIYDWIKSINNAVLELNEDTYFVGHSLGCLAIARYLEGLSAGVKIGGVVFVAGFIKRLLEIQNKDIDVVKEWIESPLDLAQVKTHFKKSVAIFSDNDPYVALEENVEFKNKIDSQIIIEHNKGHFTLEDGVTNLPVVLDAILMLVNKK
mgnify:CR=1 FL=1